MYTLGFSLIWTVLMTAGVVSGFVWGDFDGESTWFKLIFAAMPLVGLLFIWNSLRKLRRFHSVRAQDGVFAWTELDGSRAKSTTDPRIAWDAEDRDFSDN